MQALTACAAGFLESSTMVEGRNVRLGCLFALCTLVSALAQTTTGEMRASEDPPGANGVSSIVQEIPLHATAAEQGQLAQRFVGDRLAVWRQRLKLEDWSISAVMVRISDLPPKTLGGIRWDKPKKSAVIWVLDPSDYRLPFGEMLDDMELTIVHELVHLDLASLPRGTASRSSEERAVNGIAEAMLGLERKKY
jgi:hypothetical protein